MVIDVKSKGDKYSQFYKSSWDEFCEKLTSTGHATQFGDDAVFITDLKQFLETHQDVFFNNNLYQLNFYACNEFLRERGINLAALAQYNKNDSRLREIRFVPDPSIALYVEEKFKRVAEVIDLKKSPETLKKEYMLGSSKCGFCPYKKQCWPEDDALKKYFETLPPKQWARDLDRLPQNEQAELGALFKQYHELSDVPNKLEGIEEKIVSTLDRLKVYKIRLNKDQIYRVKRLKSGGAGGGERMVLRRDKA